MKDHLAEYNEDMLFADGFGDALVGIVERANLPTIACYDKNKCIEILMKDMTSFEAEDYFQICFVIFQQKMLWAKNI